jgi:hypothetical protein
LWQRLVKGRESLNETWNETWNAHNSGSRRARDILIPDLDSCSYSECRFWKINMYTKMTNAISYTVNRLVESIRNCYCIRKSSRAFRIHPPKPIFRPCLSIPKCLLYTNVRIYEGPLIQRSAYTKVRWVLLSWLSRFIYFLCWVSSCLMSLWKVLWHQMTADEVSNPPLCNHPDGRMPFRLKTPSPLPSHLQGIVYVSIHYCMRKWNEAKG